MKNIFFLIPIIVNLCSCNCDKTFTCQTLSDSASALLPFNSGDTIKFINDSGVRIQFIVNSKITSPSYETTDCRGTGVGGCNCGIHNCEGSGNILATSDTIINGENDYFLRITEVNSDSRNELYLSLYYSIFDCGQEIYLSKPTIATVNDSLKSFCKVGNHIYTNVYIHIIDTLSGNNLNKIWKVYCTKSEGVVGFRTRQDQNYFYRE
jgi:hypothetical protein